MAQVKQYCEMESHEERLHKLVMQSKINETKDVMKRKASEIDKSKVLFRLLLWSIHTCNSAYLQLASFILFY